MCVDGQCVELLQETIESDECSTPTYTGTAMNEQRSMLLWIILTANQTNELEKNVAVGRNCMVIPHLERIMFQRTRFIVLEMCHSNEQIDFHKNRKTTLLSSFSCHADRRLTYERMTWFLRRHCRTWQCHPTSMASNVRIYSTNSNNWRGGWTVHWERTLTVPRSIISVSITTIDTFCSQIICQWWSTVFLNGPWQAMYSRGLLKPCCVPFQRHALESVFVSLQNLHWCNWHWCNRDRAHPRQATWHGSVHLNTIGQ